MGDNIDYFSEPFAIAVPSVACIVLLIIFVAFRRSAGGRYLDEFVSRSKSQEFVDRLTTPQVTTHLCVTRLLDTVFPICYGLCLISITLRFAGTERPWLVIPALLAVAADFAENGSHVTALKTRRVPSSKPVYSITKWICVSLAIIIALFAWLFIKSAA